MWSISVRSQGRPSRQARLGVARGQPVIERGLAWNPQAGTSVDATIATILDGNIDLASALLGILLILASRLASRGFHCLFEVAFLLLIVVIAWYIGLETVQCQITIMPCLESEASIEYQSTWSQPWLTLFDLPTTRKVGACNCEYDRLPHADSIHAVRFFIRLVPLATQDLFRPFQIPRWLLRAPRTSTRRLIHSLEMLSTSS